MDVVSNATHRPVWMSKPRFVPVEPICLTDDTINAQHLLVFDELQSAIALQTHRRQEGIEIIGGWLRSICFVDDDINIFQSSKESLRCLSFVIAILTQEQVVCVAGAGLHCVHVGTNCACHGSTIDI